MSHDPNPTHPTSSVDPSRRSFLAQAAALAGTAAVAGIASARQPSKPQAKARAAKAAPRVQVKDGETIRVGVIGPGGPNGCAMGMGHCLALARINKKGAEKVTIAAICDLNELHLKWAKEGIDKEQGGSVETHKDYKELLARKDIHAVVAAVPEHWHGQIGIDTILAGKDLYLEKPMTLNLEDALRLYEVHQANPDVIVQIGPQKTNLPKYHEAKKVIESGLIGTPTFSQASYCRNSKEGEWHYKVNPEWKPGVNLDWDTWCGPLGKMAWDPKLYYQWRRYRKTSTGVIGDLLVHEMTPMMMAINQGWPVRVAATGGHLVDKDMENHDNVNIVAQFETGHQMLVVGSTCNEVGVETMIRGHKGNIYLNSRHCVVRPERTYSDDFDEKTIQCPDIGDDQDKHRMVWLDCIRTRKAPISTVLLGLQVMVIVDLATRSMWDGRAYAFDPKTMTSKAL